MLEAWTALVFAMRGDWRQSVALVSQGPTFGLSLLSQRISEQSIPSEFLSLLLQSF